MIAQNRALTVTLPIGEEFGMLRIGKIALVWMAVVLLAVDPAAACRFRCYR